MKRVISCIIAILAIFTAVAQSSTPTIIGKDIIAWGYTDRLMIGVCNIEADYDVLDTALVAIDYRVSYRNSHDSHLDVRYRLLCGKQISLFYSVAQQNENMARYKNNWSDEELDEFYAAGVPTIVIPTEVYSTAEEVRARHNIPFADDIMYEYREATTHIEWQLTNQTREICGYLCSSAEAMFGGRMWRVWFAPEIPISSGPWLLGDLPGMILSAEDSDGDFRFEMEGISQKNEEIRLYDWITKQITKKQWLKFEKNAHLNPYSQFSKGGQVRFYDSSDMRELKSEWHIEYYPLLK
jgi:GLPGLI family protein